MSIREFRYFKMFGNSDYLLTRPAECNVFKLYSAGFNLNWITHSASFLLVGLRTGIFEGIDFR